MPDECEAIFLGPAPARPEPVLDAALSAQSPARSLARLAERVVRHTPGCCGAAATAHSGEEADEAPTAVTHPDLSALLAVQWETGEGPVLQALRTGHPAGADDLLLEERWPCYRARALDMGLRSSATLPYRRDGLTLAVTVFGFRPRPLADTVDCPAALLGELAATGLARDLRFREALAEVEQLEGALRSRPVVDQACGIVMYVLGCDAEEAFALLRRISQHTNRKLAELAGALVRTRGHGIERELRRFRPGIREPGESRESRDPRKPREPGEG
ncbi:GAF and ANTAR domain-containing protein [Streptomyces sp. TRM 70361]|uniref:ANTAR domain-containing response regulator n=1 Tax=Streptomyces sp. TRM 70361 TaxID=3116553 RepID=UPI002E7AC302|nr:GAF and ANTAR domain-containing protein [Streptomyces sp. TRM 70361]MEE1941921.1 GAF and ANTAR domain-containing protein [Streptomyces sp. TRM 70361]